MSDDNESPSTASERIAALHARRAAGTASGAKRPHAAKGARRATLLASVAAVAGLTGGFALHAQSNSASSAVAAKKTAATTNTTTAPTSAATTASTTATTTQTTTAQAVTTSQGS